MHVIKERIRIEWYGEITRINRVDRSQINQDKISC